MHVLILRFTVTLAALLLGGVTAASVVGQSGPRPQILPFTLQQSLESSDIYLLDLERRLLVGWTKTQSWKGYPTLSADGMTLVWNISTGLKSSLLLTSPLYAGRARVLAPAEVARIPSQRQAAWSPDGQALAFVGVLAEDMAAPDTRQLETYRLSVGGSAVRLGQGQTPAWSPDGRYLALSRWSASGGFDLHVLDMTCAPACPTIPLDRLATHERWPAWSPDGRQIAFLGAENDRQTPHYDLYVASTDCLAAGGDACLGALARSVWLPPGWRPLALWPIFWSADGERLVFLSYSAAARAANKRGIGAGSAALYAQRADCAGPGPGCTPELLFTFTRWLPG